ncbi:MAG TPA: WD40 repeat domain-containing protein, partial [Caldilineaceae bacterium]|nr:WD40 repeat domain-containing protein [Caldilineaceae bacterium]
KLAKGYTGTNIIHLMLQLSPELQGEDFSGLSLRQADFRTSNLVGVDLRNTELATTRFADGFGIVLAVAVSPDGQFLAVGAGQVVVVWWLQTLKPHTIFEGHPRDVGSIAFSPDGRFLASASFDGTIIIWNVATVEKVNRFKSTVGDVISIAFSPDGETLVCGGYNGRIGIWDWSRGEKLGLLAPEERILRLAFASTGELLVNIGYRGVVQAWDIAAQKVIYSLHNDNKSYVANSALAVGHSLFWTNQGEVINGWDWRKREFFCELRGLQVSIEGLALSPDEEQLASAHADGTIMLWDLRRRQPLRFLTGHQGSVRTLAYTPDGHHLISGGYDETVRIWGVQTGLEEKRLQGHFHFVHMLRFSPNGESLAGVSLTGLAYLWRGPDLNALQTLQGHKSAIRTVAFSPDGRLMATGSDDGRVKIWDVQASALRYAFSAHADHVWTVAFDHSGGYLASSGLDNTICLWDVASGHLLQTIPLSGANTMDGIAFHPHSALLTYCDTDNHIYIWEVETGRVVASAAVASQPKVVAYSPDGRYLACGAYDGSITIWALVKHSSGVTLSQCWRLQPSTQCVWGVVFSPDGSLLAWNGEQRDIYVASIAEGAVLYSINGTHLARCIAFSADGQHLLTDGSGLDLCVYDALTGEVHQPLKGHTANLTSIVSSPTSSTVASSDASGVVKLWDLATGTALATTQLNGPYLGTNITGATGLTQGQRQTLLALGAVLDS